MSSTRFRVGRSLLIIAPLLAAASCDPVRPGGYSGTYPGQVRIQMPQTPELAAVVAQPDRLLSVELRAWRFRPPRQWTYLGGGLSVGGGADQFPASVDAWPALAGGLDWSTRFYDPDYYGPMLVAAIIAAGAWPLPTEPSGAALPGLVATAVKHVLLTATADMDVEPLGPTGPTIRVTRGFHIFERTCTQDGQQSFAEVALDTPLPMTQLGWVDRMSFLGPTDPTVASCGIDATATIDLGAVAAPVPLDAIATVTPQNLQVAGFAWNTGADELYLVAQQTGALPVGRTVPYAQINKLLPGQSATILVSVDDFSPPLAVATGGTSLLVWAHRSNSWEYVRQSLDSTVTPLQAPLPSGFFRDPVAADQPALSPDSNLLATCALAHLEVTDLRDMSTASIPLPDATAGYCSSPRAFSPDGKSLLLEIRNGDGSCSIATAPLNYTGALPTSLGSLTLLLATPGPFPDWKDFSVKYFWSASGPQVLIQDANGARVHNLATQQEALMVEANRVAAPTAPIDVVAATDQAFAWAVECAGLGETSCRTELRRLSLGTGTVHRMATADQALVFAVSADGRQIAFADDSNIYLKAIAP
jgi:hypothetical protein